MKRYDFEIVNENAFRIKDVNGHTKAYVARNYIKDFEVGFYISPMPERKDPKYQTEEWKEYIKELHKRIVWNASSGFNIACWVVDEKMNNLKRLFKVKNELYIVTTRFNEANRQYEISVKVCPWKDEFYKEFKLFKSLESWSHFDNSITYYEEYIPEEWR